MAENLNKTNGNEGDNSKDNPQALASEIRAHVKDLQPFEKAIQNANESIRKLNLSFKSATGITLGDFRAGRRYAEMQNPDEQQQKIDHMTQVFNALAPGEQVSMSFTYPKIVAGEADDADDEGDEEDVAEDTITVEDAEAAFGDGETDPDDEAFEAEEDTLEDIIVSEGEDDAA